STPCPINAQKLTERCGEPGASGFAASSQPAGYTSSTPAWSWTIPSGWSFNGPSNTQFINVNTNGQNGGNVVATFSDYGVSSACTLNIPLVIVTPGTFVDGADRLCEQETYTLSSILPAGSTATWSVTPANAPVTPLSGSGVSATITPLDGPGGAAGSEATITFLISGCGTSTTVAKDMFVGKPNIVNPKIDTEAGWQRVVCPGWHTMGATVLGDDSTPPCLTWQLVNNVGLPPHTLYNVNCSGATIYMNPQNTAPAQVKVTADNECGTFQQFFWLYPYASGCDGEYEFQAYPNPASSVLNLEVIHDNGMDEPAPATIHHAQLINMMGTTALDLPNLETTMVEMDLSTVPNGLYVVRAQVGNEWLTETVQVSKE
ncbi:MAG: T9SS type A sorting domain-containing protein, partial [Bacteroidota bacterium]